MSNKKIKKIAVDMQSKLAAMRERDVVVDGSIEDPFIAKILLQTCADPKDFQKNNENENNSNNNNVSSSYNNNNNKNGKKKILTQKSINNKSISSNATNDFNIDIKIPIFENNVLNNHNLFKNYLNTQQTTTTTIIQKSSINNKTIIAKELSKIACCLRSIKIMHAMKKFEILLRKYNVLELYRKIEMPLLFSVSDAELNGFKINSFFFTSLRSELKNRCDVIEFFLKTLLGNNFNIDSTNDVQKLKKNLVLKFENVMREYCLMNDLIIDNGCNNNNINEKNDENSTTTIITTKNLKKKTIEKKVDFEALKIDIKKTINEHHPLFFLINEYRSHHKLLPLCITILNSRFFIFYFLFFLLFFYFLFAVLFVM
jgi:hypothetical protein